MKSDIWIEYYYHKIGIKSKEMKRNQIKSNNGQMTCVAACE